MKKNNKECYKFYFFFERDNRYSKPKKKNKFLSTKN